jgi:hypothetical protein
LLEGALFRKPPTRIKSGAGFSGSAIDQTNLLRRFQISILIFAALMRAAFCTAFVFVATRHLVEKITPSGVMHLFVGRKLEMPKPHGYPFRSEL